MSDVNNLIKQADKNSSEIQSILNRLSKDFSEQSNQILKLMDKNDTRSIRMESRNLGNLTESKSFIKKATEIFKTSNTSVSTNQPISIDSEPIRPVLVDKNSPFQDILEDISDTNEFLSQRPLLVDGRSSFQRFLRNIDANISILTLAITGQNKQTDEKQISVLEKLNDNIISKISDQTSLINNTLESIGKGNKVKAKTVTPEQEEKILKPKKRKPVEAFPEPEEVDGDVIDPSLTKKIGSKISQSIGKSINSAISNIPIFGDIVDFVAQSLDTSFTEILTSPFQVLKKAGGKLKDNLSSAMNDPIKDTISEINETKGPLQAIAAIPKLLLLKLVKPLFGKQKGSVTDVIECSGENIEDGLDKIGKKTEKKSKKTFSFLGTGMGLGLFKMGKKVRNKIIKTFTFLGIAMAFGLNIMAAIVSFAIAALPFVIGALLVAAAIGIGVLVFKNWDKVKSMWNKFIVEPILNFFTDMGNTIGNFWTKNVSDPLINMFSGLGDSISGIFKNLGDMIDNAIRALPFGDKIADNLFGEESSAKDNSNKKERGEVAIDKTQLQQESVRVEKTNSKLETSEVQLSDEFRQALVDIKMAVREGNKQTVVPAPAPASDIEDLGTLLATVN